MIPRLCLLLTLQQVASIMRQAWIQMQCCDAALLICGLSYVVGHNQEQHLGSGPQCVDTQAGVQCWPGQCFRYLLQSSSTECMIQVVMHLQVQ
jgi:hypothetical protein